MSWWECHSIYSEFLQAAKIVKLDFPEYVKNKVENSRAKQTLVKIRIRDFYPFWSMIFSTDLDPTDRYVIIPKKAPISFLDYRKFPNKFEFKKKIINPFITI